MVTAGAIFRLSLFYGVAGFGGGYSVLAQLRRELVDKRRWLDEEEFLVLAELSKSLPGTPATNLITLLGQRVGGVRGGVLAAVAFLAPSTILMVACAAAYSLMRRTPGLSSFFDGMSAAMVGVVAATTLELARSALRNVVDLVAAVGCAAILALHLATEPTVAAIAIMIGLALAVRKRAPDDGEPPKSERLHAAAPWFLLLFGLGAGALVGLVRVFVPIGALTFGGGLAMVPEIERTVVVEQGWLGPKAFADAVALGQITPGPIAICATFIGYRVGGLAGALVATVAMFAPATAIALVVGHSIERFRRSPLVVGALRALAPAVIGMLVAATISLAHASIDGWLFFGVAVVTLLVLLRFSISPLWPLVLGGLVHVLQTVLRS